MTNEVKMQDINVQCCLMQFAFIKNGHKLLASEWDPSDGLEVKGAEAVGYAIVAFFEGEELVLASDRLYPTPEDALDLWDVSPAYAEHVIGYVNFDVAMSKLAESIGFELK